MTLFPNQPPRPDDLKGLQEQRLRRLIETAASNPFWQARLSDAGLTSGQSVTLDDLSRVPLTTKQALVEDQLASPPYGTNLTWPLARYSRLHQTSGTSGTPLRWLDTPESWDWVVSCWSQIYEITGVTAGDVIAFPFSFGPFLGFWAAFEAAARIGALCISAGGLSSQARLQMMVDNKATVVCCTPTYALRLVETAKEEGIDLSRNDVRKVIVAGEPGGSISTIRGPIERGFGARVFDHWGMTEVGPLAIECPENPGGLHVLETECIAEILDPRAHRPVTAGQQGELVITNLGRAGSPLFRYRTGDLVEIDTQPCPCGRNLLRLSGGILGRIDDMFTIRGNNVFPASIEAVLRQFAEIAEYRIDVSTHRSMQHVRITVEPRDPAKSDNLVLRVARAIKDRLHFQAEVIAAAAGELPRFEHKSRRFFRSS